MVFKHQPKGAVFFCYKSLLENISNISCIFALAKKLAPIHKCIKDVLQLTSLSLTCNGCHGIYEDLFKKHPRSLSSSSGPTFVKVRTLKIWITFPWVAASKCPPKLNFRRLMARSGISLWIFRSFTWQVCVTSRPKKKRPRRFWRLKNACCPLFVYYIVWTLCAGPGTRTWYKRILSPKPTAA